MATPAAPAASRPDLVDTLAAAYLALPIALFCAAWLKPLFGAALLVALALVLAPFLRPARAALPARWVMASLLLAFAWTALGGAGHFFYANPFDWVARDAVLRDLVVYPWPVYYSTEGIAALALRAPLAYYLPPAALGKLLGLGTADGLLYLWTGLGVALSICLGLQATGNPRHRLLWLLLLPWFSGMDALGWWITGPGTFPAGEHLEWWAGRYQYSSQSTLLFWVPNHAIPAWLFASWVIKHWRGDVMLPIFALALAVSSLWGPLMFVPVVVFGLAWCLARPARLAELLRSRSLLPIAGAIVLALCTGLWVTADTASVPAGFTIPRSDVVPGLGRLLRFELLEWALLAMLVWRAIPRSLLLPTLLCLTLLPLLRFGLSNDLVMRASIAPLAILWWFASGQLAAGGLRRGWRQPTIAGLLLIGAITPAQEMLRALREPRWAPDLAHSLPQKVTTKTHPHYFADYSAFPSLITGLLRPPSETGTFAVPGTQ
jgi:hypothetical protein